MQFDVQPLKSNIREGLDVYKVLGVKEWEGQLIVDYYPFLNTLDMTEEASQLMDNNERAKLVAFGVEVACKRIKKWNMVNGGEPIPVEPEAVKALVPDEVLEDIGEAITKDRNLGKKKGTR